MKSLAVAIVLFASAPAAADGGVDTAHGVHAGFVFGSVDRDAGREGVFGGAAGVRERLGPLVLGAVGHLGSGGYRHAGAVLQLDLASGEPTFRAVRPRLFIEAGLGLERAETADGDRWQVARTLGLGVEWGYSFSVAAIAEPGAGLSRPTVLFQSGTSVFW